VCLALADAIPSKKETARFEWRAAARHPLKANLATSAPAALALDTLDGDAHLAGVRHFLCAMVYDNKSNTADCVIVREVSLEDMSGQSLMMLPKDTVMFQLKGQRRRAIDSLAKEVVDVVLMDGERQSVMPAVLGRIGDRFFPGCTEASDMDALKATWSREMDAVFAQDFEETHRAFPIGEGNGDGSQTRESKEVVEDDHAADRTDHTDQTQSHAVSTAMTNAVTIPRIPSCQETGRLVLADPIDACGPLRNPEQVEDGIVVVKRGDCAFHTKAIHAQAANARAVIVVNGEGAPFVLDGDPQSAVGHPPVTIPCVMVGSSDGRGLLAMDSSRHIEATLRQPVWNTRVERAMDLMWGGGGSDGGGDGGSDGGSDRRTCPPPPSFFSNTTQRDTLVFQYEAQVPLQLDLIFASGFSTVHTKLGNVCI
jgi:hypothetical protein